MKIAIILILLVLLLVGVGLVAFGVYQRYKDQEDADEQIRAIAREGKPGEYTADQQRRAQEIQDSVTLKRPSFICGVLLAIITLVSLIFIPGSIHQVDTGEIAVVKHLGKVKGTRGPGINFDFWMTNSYTIYDTKVRTINIDTMTYSKDNQIIGVQADLQYTIDAAQVDRIATEYGGIDKLESKINSIALDNIKSVFAQNTATDVINNRSQISANISETVNNSIDTDYYVKVKTIVLTNIDFTDDFEAAVAAKVAADQEAQKAEKEAEKARIEAEAARDVAQYQADADLYKAQNEAKAKLAAAQADAEAQLLIANAEAKATKIKAVEVARMLGFNITETQTEDGVEYEIDFTGVQPDDERYKLMVNYLQYVQYLEAWDGTLPVTLVGDDTATIVIPSV